MSDCRKRYCSYCGLAPCVGGRCPQFFDDDDEAEYNPDAWEPDDWDDDEDDRDDPAECLWCGEITPNADFICDDCGRLVGL